MKDNDWQHLMMALSRPTLTRTVVLLTEDSHTYLCGKKWRVVPSSCCKPTGNMGWKATLTLAATCHCLFLVYN